jgi:hypothetical protein
MKLTLLESLDIAMGIVPAAWMDKADERHAEMTAAADKLEAVIDDTERGLEAYRRGDDPSRLRRDRPAHFKLVADLEAIAAHFDDYDDGFDPPTIVRVATEAAATILDLRGTISWRDQSLHEWDLIRAAKDAAVAELLGAVAAVLSVGSIASVDLPRLKAAAEKVTA